MYKSYSYRNMPVAITEKPKPKPPPKPPATVPPSKPVHKKEQGILDNIQNDDIILFIVILALLLDDCDDKIMLAILAFVFLGDKLV